MYSLQVKPSEATQASNLIKMKLLCYCQDLVHAHIDFLKRHERDLHMPTMGAYAEAIEDVFMLIQRELECPLSTEDSFVTTKRLVSARYKEAMARILN